ncbi:MAG: hypothetical protein ACRDTD_26350 [Pseudonocardiaceae bacterium]
MATRQQLTRYGRRLTRYEQLALQVLDIINGCNLIPTGHSIRGGINYYFAPVDKIVDKPPEGQPKGLIIEIRPGQMPDDFIAKEKTIAYHLDIAAVKVVPLPPPPTRLILLELHPKPFPYGGWSILLREP